MQIERYWLNESEKIILKKLILH